MSFVSNVTPGAIVAGASAVGIPGAGLIAALPGLIGNLIAPSSPTAGFQVAAAVPKGTDFRGLFGLTSPRGSSISGEPIFNPLLLPNPGGEDVTLLGRFGQAFVEQTRGTGASASQIAANQALSFVPSVAARGEATLQRILDAPIAPLSTGRPGVFSNILQTFFDQFGGNEAERVAEISRRENQIAAARVQAREQAAVNPFFSAVASASAAGLLPGTVTSTAALQAFGRGTEAFGPVQRTISTLPVAAVATPPVAPSAIPAIPTASPTTEVSTMTTIPTGGLFSNFLGGLGEVIQASTPLLQTILPPLLGPGPQQFPQQQFFPQQLPGQFVDPRTGTLPVQQAGVLGDFFTGGGLLGSGLAGGGNCIVPQTRTSTTLPARVDVPLPNGRFTTYKNMGQPVLFRGDLAACKRVRRIGRDVKKSLGGR